MAGKAHSWSRKGGRSPEERFWEKVIVVGDCWIWQGVKTKSGYGLFQLSPRKGVQVHRWAFEQYVKVVEPGLYVLHKTECTSRACVNYERHLYEGTQKQNMADRETLGHHLRGERSPRAKVLDSTIPLMRAEREAGAKVKDIAERYGLHSSYVSRLVRGERRKDVLALTVKVR